LVQDLTTTEFRSRLGPDAVVLVPWGIVEEHGPHLPLDTDTVQAEAVCRRAAERAGAWVLPPVHHGNCSSTRPFPGSLSLSFDTVRAVARDLYRELARNGVTRVMVVSGHAGGGHMRALNLAGEEVVAESPNLRLMVLSDWDLLRPLTGKVVAGVQLPEKDGHGGTLETARMLDLCPDRVKQPLPGNQPFNFPAFLVDPHPERGFPSGVMGNPSLATPELGRALNDYIVERLVELIQSLRKL
ncbi:MAG TPA: creatininase family protein, partial [Candidatus Thermoplasmatota archaeon]|nr:creatininase family protein [Candidatus Thermoplasmatota archaeon]